MKKKPTALNWFYPLLSLGIGVLFFVASALGGQPVAGVSSLAIMVLYAAALAFFGRRNALVGILRGQPADERLAGFDLRATAVAGTVALLIALGAYVWEIAHGRDGLAFILVCAPAGLAYILALLWFQHRH